MLVCSRVTDSRAKLLFRASAASALELAADQRHLGAEIGMISILHTWGQNLLLHPHVHCVIPAGGLSVDHDHWVHPHHPFFLPVKALSRVFRGKFVDGLKRLYRRGKLNCSGPAALLAAPKQFAKLLRNLYRQDWVVYVKPSGAPRRCCATLADTPIESRFPIIGSSPSLESASRFAIRTTHTAANTASWR